MKKDFSLKSDALTRNQLLSFCLLLIFSIILKIILLPYNMMDMGDSATRVWNALWWAQNPFFVTPDSGHPFWFYFMGTIIMVTHEIFYTSIITMILLMTIAGIYLFKTALILSDFRTAILTFIIFSLNPVIFRLNFEPYSQQTYLTAVCIMVYYLIKAIYSEKSKKNFAIAGLFSFVASFSRPEAIFILVPLCLVAFLSKKKGYHYYIGSSLVFQFLWIIVSILVYGSPFKTFQSADQYTDPVNIHDLSLTLRLKGFFLPYYFLILGLTIILFFFFIKGVIHSIRRYPRLILVILFIPILIPAIINGVASVKSTVYHTTHYFYLMFYFSPFFAAIGLNEYIKKFGSSKVRIAVSSIVILSCIPLSYVKDFVPEKYNKLFPKVIQFIATAEDPPETRKLINFIDENIDEYPALIFDAEGSESSILYVPFRTKYAPPEKVLIGNYNIPQNVDSIKTAVGSFMKKNRRGIVILNKGSTLLEKAVTENFMNYLTKREELKKWTVYVYSDPF
jgi:dolichyl-phosphate-mannose-protein mannosyltransferase